MKTIYFTVFIFTFSFIHAQSQIMPDSSLWPTSPDSGLVIGYGFNPLIVSDDNGGAIVALRANNPEQVIVTRVNRYGWLQWSGLSAGGIEDFQELTDVTEDGTGGILIAFLDIDQINMNEYYYYAMVQRIDHDGNKLWGNGVRVAIIDSVLQYNPQIASDGNGGCIVNFLDNRFAPTPTFPDFDIFTQRIDSAGNLCWGDSAMRLTTLTGNWYNPMMLVNEHNDIFLRWSHMQKLDLDGNKLWGNSGIPIGNLPGKISLSDMMGGFFVSGVLYINNIYRISCNHVDSTGQKLWGNDGITLVDSVLFGHNESDVTGIMFDDSGNIIISYFFAKSGQPDTYLQKLTPTGMKLFGDEGINVSDTSAFSWGGGIVESEYNIICLWKDGSPATSFASRYDLSGNPIWNDKKRIFGFGDFATDGQGGVITVIFISDFSINLSKISKNGIIGEVITSIDFNKNEIIPDDIILNQNYPNPFNGKTIVKYWLNKTVEVELKIYDITGKTIQTLVRNKQAQGEHQIEIDMNDFATGMYFCQLTAGNLSQVKKFLLIK